MWENPACWRLSGGCTSKHQTAVGSNSLATATTNILDKLRTGYTCCLCLSRNTHTSSLYKRHPNHRRPYHVAAILSPPTNAPPKTTQQSATTTAAPLSFGGFGSSTASSLGGAGAATSGSGSASGGANAGVVAGTAAAAARPVLSFGSSSGTAGAFSSFTSFAAAPAGVGGWGSPPKDGSKDKDGGGGGGGAGGEKKDGDVRKMTGECRRRSLAKLALLLSLLSPAWGVMCCFCRCVGCVRCYSSTNDMAG